MFFSKHISFSVKQIGVLLSKEFDEFNLNLGADVKSECQHFASCITAIFTVKNKQGQSQSPS